MGLLLMIATALVSLRGAVCLDAVCMQGPIPVPAGRSSLLVIPDHASKGVSNLFSVALSHNESAAWQTAWPEPTTRDEGAKMTISEVLEGGHSGPHGGHEADASDVSVPREAKKQPPPDDNPSKENTGTAPTPPERHHELASLADLRTFLEILQIRDVMLVSHAVSQAGADPEEHSNRARPDLTGRAGGAWQDEAVERVFCEMAGSHDGLLNFTQASLLRSTRPCALPRTDARAHKAHALTHPRAAHLPTVGRLSWAAPSLRMHSTRGMFNMRAACITKE